jgi:nucleotide-binding universal stress UspA family protein
LDQAEDIARTAGIKISTSLLQARDAGHAIIEEATERKVDLILMEARQRIKLGMLELGETVNYVMKHAKCAIWVSRLSNDFE